MTGEEIVIMVVMNLELKNFLIFDDFKMNLSYPKKPVNSTIPEEHLTARPNFRYKKIVILMGANATGKTALGRIMMGIFNFISRKEYSAIVPYIEDPGKDASFSIDLAYSDFTLYRIIGKFKGHKKESDYKSDDITITVQAEPILKNDSYERCLSRLLERPASEYENYIKALETVPFLTWSFELPFALGRKQRAIEPILPDLYARVLQKTLQALDPRVKSVSKIPNTENSFVIHYEHHIVIIQEGIITDPDMLSSGTVEGIGVANMLTAIRLRGMDFFFCDEKFSHIHSVSEKVFLSLMIDLLRENQQLIYTTHNTDILEMDLPLHSFAFLRRDGSDEPDISCVFASDYLKKNTASLKNAVENDIFSDAPDTDSIFAIGDLLREVSV